MAGRSPSYSQAEHDAVVSLLQKGKTYAEIEEETGLSTGVIGGIKRKAGLVKTRGGRKSSASPKPSGSSKSPVDSLLRPFLSAVKEEEPEGPTESEQIIQLREELANIERESLQVARRHEALKLAHSWWTLRLLRLNEGEEDPGPKPPQGWHGEEEGDAGASPKKKAPRRKTTRKK